MKEFARWVWPAVRFQCADATARTAGITNPCGVINGTPHGFLFDTKKFLQAVSKILLWIGH
jgi:hypothetical protein